MRAPIVLLLPLLGIAPGAPALEAQGALRPRVSATLGFNAIRSTYRSTGPVQGAVDGSGLLAGGGVGLGVSRRVTADVEFRSALTGPWRFRVLSGGITLRSAGRGGGHLRLALARLGGSLDTGCPAGLVCPGANDIYRAGFEFALGVQVRAGRLEAGPRLWWLQSLSGLPTYRALGAGLVLGVF